MPGSTPHLGLPYPLATELVSNGPGVIQNLATALDGSALYQQGTYAARPGTVPASGNLYYATDTGQLFVSDGTTWQATTTVVFYEEKTWAIPGPLAANPGVTDARYINGFRLPLAAGQTARLVDAYGMVQSGSATFSIYRKPWGGTDATIATGKSLSTTEADYSLTPTALSHRDRIRPQLTAVSSAYGLELTLVIEHTIRPS